MQNKAEMKVIKVWRNMSVLQLADAMNKDLGILHYNFENKLFVTLSLFRPYF